jgi:hypothetical protein
MPNEESASKKGLFSQKSSVFGRFCCLKSRKMMITVSLSSICDLIGYV